MKYLKNIIFEIVQFACQKCVSPQKYSPNFTPSPPMNFPSSLEVKRSSRAICLPAKTQVLNRNPYEHIKTTTWSPIEKSSEPSKWIETESQT